MSIPEKIQGISWSSHYFKEGLKRVKKWQRSWITSLLCLFFLAFSFQFSPLFTPVFRKNLCWLAQCSDCAQEVLNEYGRNSSWRNDRAVTSQKTHYLQVGRQDWLSTSKGSAMSSGHQCIHWNKYPSCLLKRWSLISGGSKKGKGVLQTMSTLTCTHTSWLLELFQ